jgi:hypothetical protein
MTTVNAAQGFSGSVAETIDRTMSGVGANAESVLPDPVTALAVSGDPGAELAALAVKSGEQQQTDAQAARDAQEKTEVSEDNQQVAAMNQKADEMRAGGLTEGLGMIAEGGFQMAAAGVSVSGSKDATLESAGLKLDGTFLKAASVIDGAANKAAEANADATAAAAKSASDQAKSAADDLHDAKKAGGDLVSAALDFYREYTSAQASASSAALHRA